MGLWGAWWAVALCPRLDTWGGQSWHVGPDEGMMWGPDPCMWGWAEVTVQIWVCGHDPEVQGLISPQISSVPLVWSQGPKG